MSVDEHVSTHKNAVNLRNCLAFERMLLTWSIDSKSNEQVLRFISYRFTKLLALFYNWLQIKFILTRFNNRISVFPAVHSLGTTLTTQLLTWADFEDHRIQETSQLNWRIALLNCAFFG